MISIFADRETLSRAAAGLFSDEARRAVAARGCFTVLLSGGETPRRAYEILAQPPWHDGIPWERVSFFWGDERCVPADDPRSNAGMVRRALLDHVPVPHFHVHPILCTGDAEQAAEAYEKLLRSRFPDTFPRFDLVFLGLGDDGHTASLFPGDPAVTEQERWTAVTRRSGEEIKRVTLTAPAINGAARIAFLVSGAVKAAVLREVLENAPDPRHIPARLIRPAGGDILWLIDRDAARLLSRTE